MAMVGARGRSRDEAGSLDRRQRYGEALHFREVAPPADFVCNGHTGVVASPAWA